MGALTNPAPPSALQFLRRWRILAIVWIFAACYAYAGLNRGWVPHDEGQFAQAADRILKGEVPHRDFDEMYTGALSYVNAAAFRILGDDLRSLRLVLFGVFLLWVPAVYYVASRFGSPLMAGLVTVVATVWSIPNYPSAVPSWYNLFFASFGLAALLRYVETERRQWLFVAGLAAGLSFLVKLVGLYFVAGALLFLVSEEQRLAWTRPGRAAAGERAGAGDIDARWSRAYSAALSAVLVAFIAALLVEFRTALDLSRFLAILLPCAGVALMLLAREWQRPPGRLVTRVRTLMGLTLPLVAGVALPIVLFVVAFAVAGGLPRLYQEVLVLPQRRLMSASYPMPPFSVMLTTPMLLVEWAVLVWPRLLRRWPVVLAIVAGLGAVLIESASSHHMYQLAWRPAVYTIAFVVVTTAWFLRRVDVDIAVDPTSRRQPRVMAVVCIAALCALVELPFSSPIYFVYVAPLAILAGAALVSLRRQAGHPLAVALAVFYALFAAYRLTPGYIYVMGNFHSVDAQDAPLFLPHARTLRVYAREAQDYDRLVPLVSMLSTLGTGGGLYAGPDCPELYVLTGLPNPTRTTYEFLSEPRATTDETLAMLDTRHISVVVINTEPAFSGPMPDDLRQALRARYPETTTIDMFEVRWRH